MSTEINNNIGIHTFMLNYININTNEYSRLCKLFEKSICYHNDDYSRIKTSFLNDLGYEGIFPELCFQNGYRYLGIIITPQSLYMGKYCNLEIWQSRNRSDIDKMVDLIDEALVKISDDTHIYNFESGILSRVDLCTNIWFENPYIVKQYIKIAGRSVSKDRENYDYLRKENRLIDIEGNKHSFSVSCNNYTLTVYDKEYQQKKFKYTNVLNNEYGNVLRIELKAKRKYINSYTNGITDNAERLEFLLKNAKDILLKGIGCFFYSGDYYALEEAVRIIDETGYKFKTKEIMKDIIKEKRNIKDVCDYLLNTENLSYKKIQRIMDKFEDCDLNPTKIARKDAIYGRSHLQSLKKLILKI